MKRLFAAAFAFLMAHPALSNDVTRTIELPTDYTESQLIWSNQPKPGFIIRWTVENNNGFIEICGAVQYLSNASRQQSRNVLRRTTASYEGQDILKNMTFFKTVKTGKKEDWSQANCASSGVKAPSGRYTVSVGWDAGRARF